MKLSVQKLGTPIKTISGVKAPRGVTINQRREIIVAESNKHCISIFSPAGEKLQSFGSYGSRHGQFNAIRGVAVDGDGNILAVDHCHRIQKFLPDGKFITSIGKKGKNPLEFNQPMSIAVHPLNKKVYIVDNGNHRVQILNPDLTISSCFGSYGSANGQLSYPWDVAFDSSGNVYVADLCNEYIQVFTAEGEFLRKFGKYGGGNGELSGPTGISIDSEDVVYVTDNNSVLEFTCEGEFLTSFGSKGSGPGQFSAPREIAVDKDGVVYVSDSGNNRLQIF